MKLLNFALKNNTEAQMICFHVNTQIKGKVEWFVKNSPIYVER